MSVATQLTRITTDRNTIRNKLVSMGLATATDNLDDLASAVAGITNQGSPSANIQEGQTYSILPGYYTGGTVTGVAGGGDYDLQAKTVTPATTQQVITPDDGYYGLSQVTVNAIPTNYADVSSVTATADKVLAGSAFVTASGVLTAGTMVNNGAISGSIDGLTTTSYSVPAGYHNGSGTVSLTSDIEDALSEI